MNPVHPPLAVAVQQHQAGNLEQAERLYRQILQADPQHVDALHLLGIIACQQGKNDLAIRYMSEALRLRPDFAEARNSLGNVFREQGRLEEAAASYRLALRLLPNFVVALCNLGVVLREQGKLEEAVACLQQALRLDPNSAGVQDNLGTALCAQGRLEEAALRYREALRLQPGHAQAHSNLGMVLTLQGKPEEAAASFRQAIRLQPNYAEAHTGLGAALQAQGKLEEAVASLGQAVRLKPRYAEGYNNLGVALREQGKLEEALASLQQALQIKSHYADAHNNLGVTLRDQGRFEEALESWERVLQLKPDYAEPHNNRAMTLLLMGDFERGWPEYEWRWRCKDWPSAMPPFRQPIWDGGSLEGRTILLHAEQGLGDTLQFIRYAPLVKQRGCTTVVQCQPPLVRILTGCPGIDRLVPLGCPLPDFDVHAPLLSIPRLLRTTPATVPAAVPYLSADEQLLQHWGRQLKPVQAFKVGIAWQGSPTYRKDRDRSVPLAHFAALARVPGVQLISLQKGPGTEQLAGVADLFPVTDLGSRLDETAGAFMDTAAVMKNLDLVVTSDTAIPHLAGALGVPVWVPLPLVPDWRWLLEREDSPWYPTMRLFRQTERGNWTEVFERIARALHEKLRSRGAHQVLVEIAPGELLDKITILEIKRERITDPGKLRHVQVELGALQGVRQETLAASPQLAALVGELKAANELFWQVEDDIRDCELRQDFGPRFIELARSVYRHNDRRAALKRQINELLGSRLIEEKSYAPSEEGGQA
jgi:Flp pilus assembly protein TadD